MTLVQDNSVQAINTALLSIKRDISASTATTAGTTAGLEPGKTYNINISGNAETATTAKTARTATNANHAETAETATNANHAETVDNYHASQLWRSDGATWNPSANVVMTPSGNGSEWSFDFRNKNGATGAYWQVWDENKQTLLKVDADSGKVSAPYGLTGSKLTLQGRTVSSNSYTDTNPKLVFNNVDGSQSISLTFTDFDAVQAPASLTLNGNQGNEYFIAPCIKANNKMRIPIGAPSSPEDGCIWIS